MDAPTGGGDEGSFDALLEKSALRAVSGGAVKDLDAKSRDETRAQRSDAQNVVENVAESGGSWYERPEGGELRSGNSAAPGRMTTGRSVPPGVRLQTARRDSVGSGGAAGTSWRCSGNRMGEHHDERGVGDTTHLGAETAEGQEESSTKENEFAKEEKTGGEARERTDARACAFGLTAAHAC